MVRVERREGGVTVLTLALPDQRNAMTTELTAGWRAAIDDLRRDDALRCVLVTGEGRAFCAGGDLSWIASSPELSVDALRERMLTFYRDWLSVRDLEVPVVAAVNGPAVGAGLCLALACDLRYAARGRARFSAPFTALGLHPGMAATWMLPEAVGVPAAREMLLTGRSVDAAEALSLGLVNGVHDDERCYDETLRVAERIAGAAPIATRLTKAALARGGHRSSADALEWEGLAQAVTLATEDLREGLAARSEKRPPVFSGR
jgi:enoyl-CoA hydratase